MNHSNCSAALVFVNHIIFIMKIQYSAIIKVKHSFIFKLNLKLIIHKYVLIFLSHMVVYYVAVLLILILYSNDHFSFLIRFPTNFRQSLLVFIFFGIIYVNSFIIFISIVIHSFIHSDSRFHDFRT